MSDDYRHHRAHAPAVIIVPVPVPMEIGSNRVLREVKPPKYPHNSREHWRPAQHPPRLTKPQRLAKWLDGWAQQDQVIREYMRPDAALLRAWLSGAGVPA
jgi:hypothetical protein